MRKIAASVVAMALASSANAAVVTYHLSLHEGSNGLPTAANSFAIWATVSQGDNAGLLLYGVDLKGTGDPGGPTTLTLVNRTPNGIWEIDDADANYDGGSYPTRYAGFGSPRQANAVTGVVSGGQDLSKDPDGIFVYGVGQPPAHRMDDWRPPPVEGSLGPIPYKPYAGVANTDGGGAGGFSQYGTVPSSGGACASFPLAAGSLRIATGTWTGNAPSIEQLSANTKASVWKLNRPTGTENEPATVQFAVRDLGLVPGSMLSLAANLSNVNLAVGGFISVSGSNGNYVSEVDQLLDPPVNKGSAAIAGIGDEAGNIYVMAKLIGSAADIANLLASVTTDVDASDSHFAALHAAYDSQFGGGGFNVLFKFPNIVGAKSFNWDFSGACTATSVTIDQLAAVPEPGMMLLGVGGGVLFLRKRR